MTTAIDAHRHTERWYWLCQLGGWSLLFGAQLSVARFARWPWDRALAELAVITIVLLLVTHGVRQRAHRQDWFALGVQALASRAILISTLVALTFVVALVPLEHLLYDDRNLAGIGSLLLFGNLAVTLLLWHMIYFGSVLIYQKQQHSAEAARLRASLRTAELSLLKSQLNPHFLFNALNTVRALIVESPDRAQLAVTQLARTLRYALNSSRDELVPLETELGIVDDYLGIETLRLAERLTIVKDIAPETLSVEIPIMLLQTLVENAVKHGISQLPQGGTLRIVTRLESPGLIIEVSNDRPLVKMGSVPSDRVGLANAHERLRLMIGIHASLKLDLGHPQKAIATVRIPISSLPASSPQPPV